LELVPGATAHALQVVPLRVADGCLDIAVADPLDDRLTPFFTGIPVEKVRVHLASSPEVAAAVNRAYPAIAGVDEQIVSFTSSESSRPVQVDISALEVGDDDAPVIRVVTQIVTQALRDRASDVHIEPMDDLVRVRFRIDGALKEMLTLPPKMGQALASRIKIMADMNIVERRRPQDGQFETTIDGRELDVRVAH
jgi:type IV pilus assembly protein PilB